MTLKLSAALVLLVMTALTSCIGQSNAANGESGGRQLALAFGEVVPELDKSIWVVFQAKNDDYWFGSDGRGVYRYDGKTIIHFSTKDGLANDHIREIKEDKAGNIFFNTFGGISKFDGRQFETLTAVEGEWKLERKDLWFRGATGPYRYDGKTLYSLKFSKSPREDGFNAFIGAGVKLPYSPYEVYTIYKDSKGSIWFGTAMMGACRFDESRLTWMFEDHLQTAPNGGSFGIRSIIEDRDGKFWICNTKYRYGVHPDEPAAKDGGIRYEREKGAEYIKTPGEDRVYFQAVVKDDKQDLWMSTYGWGVWRWDGKELMHYPVMEGDNFIRIVAIFRDNKGGLWLGTEESGVYKFNGKTFERFRP